MDERMTEELYERLAEALDRLPNGFPRTPSNVEIRLLKKIFSPEEAWLAGHLSGQMEPIDKIGERAGFLQSEVRARLMKMAKRGLVWLEKPKGRVRFRLAPFIVGIYEAQVESMDHELAHLVEKFMVDGGAQGIMKPQPALHRVIPAQNTVKSEWILPYDDVRAILLASKTFRVHDCVCRVEQDYVGRRCNFPLRVCLSFSSSARSHGPDDIAQEEALKILDEVEAIGLVHTVSNVMKGIGYVCNCCGCCCGVIRGITDWGIAKSVAYANYYAVIDPELCSGCGICIERCQVRAISESDGVALVDRKRCIGCGLCVTGCPDGGAKLERKPPSEIVTPPQDFAAWEHERLINRGRRYSNGPRVSRQEG